MYSPAEAARAAVSLPPGTRTLLQRRCACGGTPGLDGECAECRRKRLQRSFAAAGSARASPIVPEALRSPGPPLDEPSRTCEEPRRGHDFGLVPVRSNTPPGQPLQRQFSDSVPTQSPSAAADADFERAHFCLGTPDPANPAEHPFTPRERQMASFGLWQARSIATRAFTNLGHRDPYHLRMAQRAFDRALTFDELDQHTSRIRGVLDNLHLDQNVVAATCDEPSCNTGIRNYVAFTRDDLSGVVLCPFYFAQPARTLATTFLHEAGHMARIDVNWAPGHERYCRDDDVINCDTICPLAGENLLENVDAWARFLYCLSVSG
jgi:hypothetical protein